MIPDDEMNLDDVVKSLEDLSKYDKKISEELEKLEKSIARGYVFSSRLNF
jgi:cell division septum initiation protein DivIVA